MSKFFDRYSRVTLTILLALLIGLPFAVVFGPDLFHQPDVKKIYQVRTCEDLQKIGNDLDGIYIQRNDIDCKDMPRYID